VLEDNITALGEANVHIPRGTDEDRLAPPTHAAGSIAVISALTKTARGTCREL
jgi:hypothetical protein